jgi:hypothetical protein
MTLTAPNCPAAGMVPAEVEAKVCAVDGVANVGVVWDPPWDKSEAARLELGLVRAGSWTGSHRSSDVSPRMLLADQAQSYFGGPVTEGNPSARNNLFPA